MIGVQGVEAALLAGTRWARLPTILHGARHESGVDETAAGANPPASPPAAAPAPSLLIERPVRSGQSIDLRERRRHRRRLGRVRRGGGRRRIDPCLWRAARARHRRGHGERERRAFSAAGWKPNWWPSTGSTARPTKWARRPARPPAQVRLDGKRPAIGQRSTETRRGRARNDHGQGSGRHLRQGRRRQDHLHRLAGRRAGPGRAERRRWSISTSGCATSTWSWGPSGASSSI